MQQKDLIESSQNIKLGNKQIVAVYTISELLKIANRDLH